MYFSIKPVHGGKLKIKTYNYFYGIKKETKEVIDEFLTLLSTCHTVIPEHKNGFTEIQYQASSPGEHL